MTRQPQKGLHKEEVKASIRMRGWTLAGLSRHWGYEASAVATALNRSWPELEARIAKLLKKEPRAVWPDRYDQDGNPLKGKRVSEKNTRQMAAHNDRFREAA